MPTAAALFNNVTLLKSYSSTESFANEEYSLQFKPFSSETCANDGSTSTTKSSGLTVQLYHYQRANEVDTKSTASTTDVQGGGALKLVVLKDSKTTILESILLASTPICKINTVLTIITLAEGPVAFKFSSSTDLHQFNDFLQAHVFSQNTSSSSASSASSSSTSSTVAVETSHFEQKTDKSSSSQYFGYYGQLTQQQNMLQDYTRTGTYQRAMLENSIDFEGKIVVDVGAGTGVLSFFAIQAGAAKVYAIEASAMAENTRLLVEKNGLKDRIIVINSKVEEVELPEKVDLIISEPMGTMLVNERMLESYIYARKWLKSNPHMELKEKEKEKEREKEKEKEKEKQSEKEKEKQDNEEGETDKSSQNNVASISPSPMFPSMAYMYCAPFTDEFLFMEQFSKVTFWFQHSFYGIDMTSLQARAMEEIFSQPVVDCIDPSILGASPICKVFNFATVSEEELCTIHLPFEFVYSAPATVHGLAFWFDVSFNGSYSTVWLSTSPMAPLTHWYQLRCLVSQPLQITRGQTLKGTVTLKANSRQSYDIDLEMQVKGLPLVVRNKVNLKEPLYRYTGVAQSSVVAQSSTMASNAANYALNGGSSSSSGDNHNGNNSNSNSDFRNMNYNDYNSYDGQFDNAYEDSATPSTNSAQ